MLVDLERLGELRERVLRYTTSPGRTPLPAPHVWALRWDEPLIRKSWSHSLSMGVILQGAKQVRIAGRTHTYSAGHYLVVSSPAETQTAVLEASPATPYLALSVRLDPGLVTRLLLALADTETPSGQSPSATTQPAQDPSPTPAPPAGANVQPLGSTMAEVLLRLLNTMERPDECRFLAPLVLEELAFRLLQSGAADSLRRGIRRAGDHQRVETALRFMQDHTAARLTVDDIARHVAMSPSHFAHRFRALVGLSPMQYLKQQRLQEARILMLHEGLGSEEAANAVGYASLSHFTRDFRRCFEEPPVQHVHRLRAMVAAK